VQRRWTICEPNGTPDPVILIEAEARTAQLAQAGIREWLEVNAPVLEQ